MPDDASNFKVPQNIEAERAVLGAMLNSELAIRDCSQMIEATEFYRPGHQIVFAAIVKLFTAGIKIDPVVVGSTIAEAGKLTNVGGYAELHDLYSGISTAVNATFYAEKVHQASVRRRIVEHCQRAIQIAAPAEDWDMTDAYDDQLSRIARETLSLELLVDDKPGEERIRGTLQTFDQFFAKPDSPQDWLIMDLMERQDVFMLLAGEGIGKSWLSRQFAMCVASGVHPYRPHLGPIADPQVTLVIDGENAESTVRRQGRYMSHQVANVGIWTAGMANIWHINDGMNLRKPEDARMFEAVIAKTEPALVAMGPLYKMFQRGNSDWDTAASETREVLDRVRRKYGCAFYIEHHMPKGSGGDRTGTPYGSSEWQRWVSHGRVLQRIGDENLYELAQTFREDRDSRDIPAGLIRSGGGPGSLPWMSVWDQGEIDVRKEELAPARVRNIR